MILRQAAFKQDQSQEEQRLSLSVLALLKLGLRFFERFVRAFELTSDRTTSSIGKETLKNVICLIPLLQHFPIASNRSETNFFSGCQCA